MKVLSYRVFLKKEPEGGYTVTVPTLPGCITFGETIEESIEMAKEAIELYIESLKEDGEDIPTEEGMLEYTLNVLAHALASGSDTTRCHTVSGRERVCA